MDPLARSTVSSLRLEVKDPQPDGTMKTIRVIEIKQEFGPDGEPIGPCIEEELDG